jgi:clan AA aspartic protease (TIGR02281 family)
MWRFALLIGFSCSVVLNVYFFMELNIRTIENKFQKEASVHLQQRATHTKKDEVQDKKKNKEKDNYSDIEGTQSAEKSADSVKAAINAKDYFNASYLINILANDHKTELSEVRLFWLHAAQALIQQKLFTHAENSISAYLLFQRDDSDFLYQQVDLYWQQQLPLLAIRYAYEMQYHVFNEVENRAAVNFARQLVQQQVDVFITNNLWLELRSLIEEVLLFDSQNPNLQWMLVRAQYQLGQFEYARKTIDPLLNQPNYKIKARALLAKIEAALRDPQSIPLSRQGEHFIVQAVMNDTFKVSLMLDTGASISLLSERAFEALSRYSEVVYVKDLQLNTAGGIVTTSIYQVDQFTIQGYTINDFIFAVSPYVSEGNDGLLGMNFLSAFDFYIDQNNNLLILKNK